MDPVIYEPKNRRRRWIRFACLWGSLISIGCVRCTLAATVYYHPGGSGTMKRSLLLLTLLLLIRESDGGSPGRWEFDKDEEMQSLLFFHENMENRSSVGSTCN